MSLINANVLRTFKDNCMKFFNVIVEDNKVINDIICDETEIKKIAGAQQGEDCLLKRGLVPKSKIIAVVPAYQRIDPDTVLDDAFKGVELPEKNPEPYSGKTDIPAFTRRAPGQKPARWREQEAPPLSAA